MALLDFDMTNVKPAGEYQELPEGEYIVRIEGTEKKGTKDKFYDNGSPHEDNGKNFYLNIALQVGQGPNQGHIEFERLNLWNTNKIATDIAKSTLKSIQDATGVYSNDSEQLHGKFMVLRVKKNSKNALIKHYEKIPADMQVNVAQMPPHHSDTAAGKAAHAANVAAAASSAPAANAKPSWAVKK